MCSLLKFPLVLQPKTNQKKGLEEKQGERITLGNNDAVEADSNHAGVSAPSAARGRQNRWSGKHVSEPHCVVGGRRCQKNRGRPARRTHLRGPGSYSPAVLICGITGTDVGHTRTDREPTVGGLTGHVDESGETRGDHVPVGKGSIREANEGTPKDSCGSRAACKPTCSTKAQPSSKRLLLRAARTDLRGASRQVVAMGA